MKKRTFISLLLLSVLIVGGIKIALPTEQKEKKYSGIAYSLASYPNDYSLDEIAKGAPFIIEGEVRENLASIEEQGIVFTETNFKVSKVHKGDISDDSVKIIQEGGTLEGVLHISDNIEILEPGKKYVLFVRQGVPSDRYVIIGGWQGQYKLGLLEAKNPEARRNLSKNELFEKIKKK